MPPEIYANLIKHSECLVGNSSSAIREGSFLGVPAVNIGSRQRNRELSDNVISVDYNHLQIKKAILKQMNKKKLKRNFLYGRGNSGHLISKKINDILNKK